MQEYISRIDHLEQELNLRQLQVNRLLNITQAINNNVSAADLYTMYASFLEHELRVPKMALFVRREDNSDQWTCSAYLGIRKSLAKYDMTETLTQYHRIASLSSAEHPFLGHFDLVIPVRHKDRPIAYVFIGGFGDGDDVYDLVQFITTLTNIIAVAIENKRLFKRQLEQQRLERDINLAAEIQSSLVPKEMPKKDYFELAAIYRPHQGVGGDYYDFVDFGDGRIVFCIGDFSGKGVSAALLMANFQAIFRTLIHKHAELDHFVRELNQNVRLLTRGNRFMTFFIADYDRYSGRLRYVNSGHNPPVLRTDDQTILLQEGSTLIGFIEDLPEVKVGEVTLTEPATIIIYTDGLTDMQNPQGAYFDEDRLCHFLEANSHRTPEAINEALLATVEAFREGEGIPDDFTVLTCALRP